MMIRRSVSAKTRAKAAAAAAAARRTQAKAASVRRTLTVRSMLASFSASEGPPLCFGPRLELAPPLARPDEPCSCAESMQTSADQTLETEEEEEKTEDRRQKKKKKTEDRRTEESRIRSLRRSVKRCISRGKD